MCQKSITDKDNNLISLVEVIERLTVSLNEEFLKQVHAAKAQKPYAFQHPFELVNMWQFDDSTPERSIEARLELLDPTAKVLSTLDYDVKIQPDQQRLRVNIKIPIVQVTVGGAYWFRVSVRSLGKKGYQEVANVPLEMVVQITKTEKS